MSSDKSPDASPEAWKPAPSYDPVPVVKADYKKNKYYPEVMLYGVNYAVGLEEKTREKAMERAEFVALKVKHELNHVVRKFSEQYSVAKP